MSAKDQIKQIVDFFKREPQLKDKTDGMAEGLLLGAQLADDANELSKETDASFKALQREYTENGNGAQTTAEITVARDGELVLDDRLKRDFGNVNAQLAKMENEKASINYVDAILMDIAKGGPRGPFNSISDLKIAYPNGAEGTWLVFDSSFTDGAHSFIWDSTNSVWKDLGVYQATGIANESIKNTKLAEKSITSRKTDFISIGKNRFNKNSVTSGYINGLGQVSPNPGTIVSDYIEVYPGEKWFRNEHLNQVGFYKDRVESSYTKVLGYNTQPDGNITIPDGVYFMRVTVNLSELNSYQIELGQTGTSYEPYGIALNWLKDKSVDSKALADNAVKDSHIENKDGRIFFEYPKPYLTIDFKNKRIFSETLGYLITNGIRIIPIQSIDFSVFGTTTINVMVDVTTGVLEIKKYSEAVSNKNMYHLATVYIFGETSYTSVNARTIRSDGTVIDNFLIHSELSEKPFDGGKIVYYGDSILNRPTMQTTITNTLGFDSSLNLAWPDSAYTVEDKLAWVYADGTFAGNPAAGGTQPENSIPVQSSFCQDDRIAYIPTDTDVVYIQGATNDMFRNKPIGNIGDPNSSFTGAVIDTVKKIQARVPNALIVLGTPIVAIDGAGSEEHKTNFSGLTTNDYAAQLEIIADYLGVPIIDVHNCGINLFNAKRMLPDGTHPNDTGTDLMRRVIIGGFKSIAP